MKPKLDKAGYPLEWPILEAGDFCKRAISTGEQRCLLGWKNMALCDNPCIPDDCTIQYYEVSNRIKEFLLDAAKQLTTRCENGHNISMVNDNHLNSLALLARIWNLAGAMLGYVVDNPEAKTLRKMNAK